MTPTVPILALPSDNPPLIIPPEELEAVEREEANLITDDGMPVESIYHEKQMRLLTHSLLANWLGPQGDRRFVAMSNVGLFYRLDRPPIVPDVLLSVGVELRSRGYPKQGTKSYFMWRYGKPPDVTIEIVSDRRGDELGEKLRIYFEIGVRYYVVFDPDLFLGSDRLYVFSRNSIEFHPMTRPWFPSVGLGVTLWDGQFEDMDEIWLRWCDPEETPLPTAEEVAAKAVENALVAEKRATGAEQRADSEAQRAEAEAQRAAYEAQRAATEALRATQAQSQVSEMEQILAAERHAAAEKQRQLEEMIERLKQNRDAPQ